MINRLIAIGTLIFMILYSAQGNSVLSTFGPPKKRTNIDIGVALVKVDEIEPASKDYPTVIAQFDVNLQWLDERLSTQIFSQGRFTEYRDDAATKKLVEIFNPNIVVKGGTTHIKHQRLKIFDDGMVKLGQEIEVIIPADLQLRQYPFDGQTFVFKFASADFGEKELVLNIDIAKTRLSDNAEPTAWSFDYSNTYVSKRKFAETDEPYSTFNFVVHAERNPWSFLWRLLIPLMVIVILSWNVFWLYGDAQAALEICFLFLLTVVSFHQIANDMLPMVPTLTFMDTLVFLSYGFIVIPVFQILLTAQLEEKGNKERADGIRKTCQWSVPLFFVLSILFSTILYFV